MLTYFVIVGTSNAVNLTDGLDGLAIMPSVMVGAALGVFAYVSGNADFVQYLRFPHIPGAGELLIFCAALAGAGLGFLWFNTYPAQVFMGDVGALALGAALGTIAVIVRQELVLLIMGGIFVVETASVIMQVASFKTHRQAHLPHGADPPSLRAQGLGRAQGHRALLDHHFHPGARGPRDAEAPMTAQAAQTARKRRDRRHGTHGPVGRAPPAALRLPDRRDRQSRSAAGARRRCRRWARSIVMRTGGFDARLLEQARYRRHLARRAARRSVLRAGARAAASTSSATSSCSRAPPTRPWSASPAPTARAPSPPC